MKIHSAHFELIATSGQALTVLSFLGEKLGIIMPVIPFKKKKQKQNKNQCGVDERGKPDEKLNT